MQHDAPIAFEIEPQQSVVEDPPPRPHILAPGDRAFATTPLDAGNRFSLTDHSAACCLGPVLQHANGWYCCSCCERWS
jgi:hypothetical protein